MLISIVMPSFNQATFIEESIRSVFNQNYSEIELIVMDGASTDQTLDILKRLKNEFGEKLKWFSDADSGPAEAINKALKKAQGSIIGWLNSDDLYHKDAIQNSLYAFKTHPNWVLLYGDGQHINEQGQFINDYPTQAPLLDAFQQGCYICQPTVFFKAEILSKVGFLNEQLFAAFDFDFWLRIFKAYPHQIGYIQQLQAYSRWHKDCITQSLQQQTILEAIKVTATHFGFAQKHWLEHYFNECCLNYPFDQKVEHLQQHFIKTVEQVLPYLRFEDLKDLFLKLHKDKRWQFKQAGIFANIYEDGWLPQKAQIKFKYSKNNAYLLVLHGQHQHPLDDCLILNIKTPWMERRQVITTRGDFYLFIDVPVFKTNQALVIHIETKNSFIPHQVEPNNDKRALSFILHDILKIHL